ncbi:hypothetical protein CRM22_009865 [Opisthorchis felineus]|uniref:G-protein coupled receptors family 1 profile domain-containing protein n=1 Tax=Opisthorchis felineus TaxID=147828 RepID=A0A4S2L6E2_OPIFE|nr:hypothetical protein CRM22_009865 [Opisthorchis felineus]
MENATICAENTFANTIAGILITHVSFAIAILGVAVNLLTLIVLRRSAARGATNLLLVVLATEDILIIFSYSLYYVAIHYYENYQLTYLGLLRYGDSPLYFVLSWVKVAEIYTIVLLSLQRYLAIRWPLHAASLCSVGRTKRVLAGVIMLSAVLKLPNLILGYREMVYVPDCKQHILMEVFRNKPWYTNFRLIHVQVLDQVIGYIIPLIALIVLNIGLITRVQKATRERMQKQGLGMVGYPPRDSNGLERSGEQTTIPRSGDQNEMLRRQNKDERRKECSGLKAQQTELSGVAISRTLSTSGPKAQNTNTANMQNRSVTLTLIGVVSTFIVFETPTTICFCYEFSQLISKQLGIDDTLDDSSGETTDTITATNFYHHVYPAALICVMIGCASNFFIYMLIGSKFRRQCLKMLQETLLSCNFRRQPPQGHASWHRKRPVRRRRTTRSAETKHSVTLVEQCEI